MIVWLYNNQAKCARGSVFSLYLPYDYRTPPVQCWSKFWHWSQCWSIPINRHWSALREIDRNWSALIGINQHWALIERVLKLFPWLNLKVDWDQLFSTLVSSRCNSQKLFLLLFQLPVFSNHSNRDITDIFAQKILQHSRLYWWDGSVQIYGNSMQFAIYSHINFRCTDLAKIPPNSWSRATKCPEYFSAVLSVMSLIDFKIDVVPKKHLRNTTWGAVYIPNPAHL